MLNHAIKQAAPLPPAVTRLASLATLDAADLTILGNAMQRAQAVRVRRDLMVEGREIVQPQLILSGWAARVRILLDGRRQFLHFLLPGDVIGMSRHSNPIAVSTVVALTEVTACPLPDGDMPPGLTEALAVSGAVDEAYLLAQIARLGRMSARERIADLMLELHERLSANGTAEERSFDMPITQEILADAMGLTAVHVNRMLQSARRSGDLLWTNGRLTIPDPFALARQVGRTPTRVTKG
ncbi:CRP-like cAMP-binding protein [Sphingomonas jinjuensis]|uniref:CRP-like cAMP-binding protein n=1 Tax=Sphingomonas jinjuensis TaxID=535907 RepID=A0A840FB59_9SPHN|nr:Crp/Fnr family transcriptional regulator [Sphingomonas jinjuensis]MBB4153872.1 CRP-like cAMP-binding protein [Sphingomonas jinjuensis]